jgi:surface antigen
LSDQEDRRRATAALATALDPQGEGTPVAWDNPTSGDKGVVTPLGHAYPDDGRICRAFSETTRQGKEVTSGKGIACEQSGGDWSVVSREAAAKPGEPATKPREQAIETREPAAKR